MGLLPALPALIFELSKVLHELIQYSANMTRTPSLSRRRPTVLHASILIFCTIAEMPFATAWQNTIALPTSIGAGKWLQDIQFEPLPTRIPMQKRATTSATTAAISSSKNAGLCGYIDGDQLNPVTCAGASFNCVRIHTQFAAFVL
jgi:hypothetical protein